ncbi:MAG: hypothetical protein C4293_08165 [Nitrospiraceae bacterium]
MLTPVMNLVSNARDAMPQGGRVTIAATTRAVDEGAARRHDVRPGVYIQLSVRDTGCGIEPEIRAHIFELFFARKKLSGGSGLGLASAYGIVRAKRRIYRGVPSARGWRHLHRLSAPLRADSACSGCGLFTGAPEWPWHGSVG